MMVKIVLIYLFDCVFVGKQQCMDGLDEDYCERLEFNECEDDEYRCANGMCIPDQYWLDGDYDCMDWTSIYSEMISSLQNNIYYIYLAILHS